jgi:hypothetical protein
VAGLVMSACVSIYDARFRGGPEAPGRRHLLPVAVLGTDLGTEEAEVDANNCDVTEQAGRRHDVGFPSGEVVGVRCPDRFCRTGCDELFLGELTDRLQHRKTGAGSRLVRDERAHR